MWIAASIAEKMTYGYVKDYGFNVTPDDAKINWGYILILFLCVYHYVQHCL